MGTIQHHAIIVASWRQADAETARNKAVEIGCNVSPLVVSAINAYGMFCIWPDGSKEGWSDSDIGDARRAKWCEWAGGASAEHVWLEWVEVAFGELGSQIVRTSQGCRGDDDANDPAALRARIAALEAAVKVLGAECAAWRGGVTLRRQQCTTGDCPACQFERVIVPVIAATDANADARAAIEGDAR